MTIFKSAAGPHGSDGGPQPVAQAALDSIGDAVLCVDLAGRVTYLNPVAARMTGWTTEEAAGRPLCEVMQLIDADGRGAVPNPLLEAMDRDVPVSLRENTLLVCRDGRKSPIEDTAAPIRDGSGRMTGGVIVFRDVGAALAASLAMARQALHDALTGLPNRLLMRDRLDRAIAAARRHSSVLAVLYMDLDGFKKINDTLGHAVGDKVLQSVAGRLVAGVRRQDTVSRQGGDEFVVLLSEVNGADDATRSAEKLCGAIAAPQRIDGRDLRVTASAGIGMYPADGVDVDTLLECADRALLRSKAGRASRAA